MAAIIFGDGASGDEGPLMGMGEEEVWSRDMHRRLGLANRARRVDGESLAPEINRRTLDENSRLPSRTAGPDGGGDGRGVQARTNAR